MKRILVAMILMGFFAPGLVAHGQPRTNERVVVKTEVTGFSPQTGPVGTTVTIRGSGFTRSLQVSIGEHLVRPTKMGSSMIQFRVPEEFGDGAIVLRKPGMLKDLNVGTFRAWSDPVITGFAPTSGVAGTRVEIRGRGFSRDDRVTLGTTPLHIESATATRIVVTIPSNASSGYLTVASSRNHVSRSRGQFVVVTPAPVIRSISPTSGTPGTIVRVAGEHFDRNFRAFYGRYAMPVRRDGPGWFEVQIPSNAHTSEAIRIRSRRGNAESPTVFRLSLPPVFASYAPKSGSVGTQVQIYGRNFSSGDRVTLAGRNCRILQLGETRMTIEIPANAQSGVLAVERGTSHVQGPGQFDVLYVPSISSIEPETGSVGSVVRIRGRFLDGARVFLGNTPVRILRHLGSDGLEVTVPRRATTAPFRVVTPGGEVFSPRPFSVWRRPRIRRVYPQSGAVGSVVTVTGENLDEVDNFYLGSTKFVIQSAAPNTVSLVVPPSAQSGLIFWGANGAKQPSRFRFSVNLEKPAQIVRFLPAEGPTGTEVRLYGAYLTTDTVVWFGEVKAQVLSRGRDGSLLVRVPDTLSPGKHTVTAERYGVRGSARQSFLVTGAAEVTRIQPARAKAGQTIVLRGHSLQNARIFFGDTELPVVNRDRRGRKLKVTVPQGLFGRKQLTVEANGQTSTTADYLVIFGGPPRGPVEVHDHRRKKR